MSEKVIVITKNADRHNVKVTLPGVGLVQPNPDRFETEREGAEELISHFPDFFIEGEEPIIEEISEKSETNELGGSNENELNKEDDKKQPETAPLSAEDKLEMIEAIKGLNYAELQEQCKAFPRKEWNGMNKDGMIEFLIGKLN